MMQAWGCWLGQALRLQQQQLGQAEGVQALQLCQEQQAAEGACPCGA